MTKDQLAAYLDAFNRKDFDGFGRFYADDVRLDVGRFVRVGRRAILDFYRDVARTCDERLTLKRIVMDETGAAIELDTEFKALARHPDFVAGPLVPGRSIFITSFIFYAIRGDRFTDIKARRIAEAVHAPSSF
ncbi:MAG: nuclear transport factor 2 family protein [Sphingomonas sp.]|jgi:predicted ester cyclase